MNKIFLFLGCTILFLTVGCNSIGNGMPKIYKVGVSSPEVIEIEGNWHVEIICNASSDDCEIIIDENLKDSFSAGGGRKFYAYLPQSMQPMVIPVLRLKLQKSFRKLSLEGNNICNIKNYKSDFLEAETADGAVCVFNSCDIGKVELEVADSGKISFKGSIKNVEAEIRDRAVLEIENVEKLRLESSDNSICRIKKCGSAAVKAEDNSKVIFKEVKTLDYKEFDDARVERPLIVSEELKK